MPTQQKNQASAPKSSAWKILRAGEWWEFKLAPVFGTIYATAFLLQIPLLSLWPLLLLSVAALAPGAAYVCVINDLTDLADDLAAGKTNRMQGRPRVWSLFLILCCVLPGLGMAWLWRGDAVLLGIYGANWLVFSLYSLPPFRWKNRGIWGVFADATGANVLPHLLVATLVFRWIDAPLNAFWLASLGVWALSYGMRGILWHQLSDYQGDALSGVRTFAQLHSAMQLHRLGCYVLFPLEVCALLAMLWQNNNPWAWSFLAVHCLLEWGRVKLWKMNIVIVTPQPRYHLALHEYYEAFYPMAFLLAATIARPANAILLLAHLMVFPRRCGQVGKDILRLSKDARHVLRSHNALKSEQ